MQKYIRVIRELLSDQVLSFCTTWRNSDEFLVSDNQKIGGGVRKK